MCWRAEIGNVVLGQVFGGQNEGETVLDVLKIGGRHHDAFEGVLRGEDDALVAFTIAVKEDIGDLHVFAVGLVGVFRDGVDLDGLAEGIVLARDVEDGFAGGEFGDDLLRRQVGGRGGIERAEAGGLLCLSSVRNCDSGDGKCESSR